MYMTAKANHARAVCPVCGKRYARPAQQRRAGKKTTCSRRCSYVLRGKDRTIRRLVACAKCGDSIEKRPSEIRRKNFCSRCKTSPVVPFPVGHRCGRWTVLTARVVAGEGGKYCQKCECGCGAIHFVRKACLNPDSLNTSSGCPRCAHSERRKTLPKRLVEEQIKFGASTFAAIARNLGSTPDVVRKSISRHSIRLPQGFGRRLSSITCGDRFGRWVVVAKPVTRHSPRGTPLRYVKCRCECGIEKDVRLPHLIGNRSTQCRRCMGSQHRAASSPHWKGNELISGALVNVFRSGAKSRDLEWAITAEDMSQQFLRQKGRCALSGAALTLPARDYSRDDGCGIHYEGNASLDRIDSTKGYVTTNIQWVEKTVNLMKRDFTVQEFVGLCWLVARRKSRHEEAATAFEERYLHDLWNPLKKEGIYSPHWKGCGAITGSRFRAIRASATSRGIEFRLSCRDVWKKFVEQRGRCALSGLSLHLHTKNSDTQWNASLDRIDSQRPYTPDNVWWVDVRLNLLKRELPLQDVLDRCRRIARHNREAVSLTAVTGVHYKHGSRRT